MKPLTRWIIKNEYKITAVTGQYRTNCFYDHFCSYTSLFYVQNSKRQNPLLLFDTQHQLDLLALNIFNIKLGCLYRNKQTCMVHIDKTSFPIFTYTAKYILIATMLILLVSIVSVYFWWFAHDVIYQLSILSIVKNLSVKAIALLHTVTHTEKCKLHIHEVSFHACE